MNIEPARLTLVESQGCHFCEDARSVLDSLVSAGQIRLHVVEATSTEGMALVARHRPPMFPLVLIGDEPFSHGRLPRRKLAKRLGLDTADVRVG